MGKTNAVLVKAEGSASSLSSVSPPQQHGVEDDNHTKHSGSLLSSRVKKQIKNHYSPFSTLAPQALVANPLVFHKPEICTKA
jgi:hypothetical protein